MFLIIKKWDDTYDFGLDEDIPYKEIFTKGLKYMVDNYKGKIANNMGWFSQNDQVITEFEITINFKYYYEGWFCEIIFS